MDELEIIRLRHANKMLRKIVKDQASTIHMLVSAMPAEIQALEAWKEAVLRANRVIVMIDNDIDVQ